MTAKQSSISVLIANPHAMASELLIGALKRRMRPGNTMVDGSR
jgi:hypothetical protein